MDPIIKAKIIEEKRAQRIALIKKQDSVLNDRANGHESDDGEGIDNQLQLIEQLLFANPWKYDSSTGKDRLKATELPVFFISNTELESKKLEFEKLTQEESDLERAVAMGREADEGQAATNRFKEIEVLLESNPWMFDPDEGTVLKAWFEVQKLVNA